MKNRRKWAEWIDKVLESDGKIDVVEFGQLFLTWFVVPLAVGINYLILWGGISRKMAFTLFLPSVAVQVAWHFLKDKRWFKRRLYW